MLLLLPSAAFAWHAPGWSHRAVVNVPAGQIDAAAVRIAHAGVAQPDADDFRVFDPAGQPVPYEVTFHDARRDTLISFRAGDGGEYTIYFGNAGAPRDPMRAITSDTVGGGPPQPGPGAGGWVPRAGLVLTTMRRPPDVDNPKTPDEMAALIRGSAGFDGADYVANISDGFNRWGDSDYFISVYRGWITLPSSGTWGFCTASNEASFSFIDGKELVHWPGRHTEQRGARGEKSAEHQLDAGLHYVEYYHEEVLLYQVAFLGWKPPGAGRYDGIPTSAFPQPRRASVVRYEAEPGQVTVMPRVQLLDSLWPRKRQAGQYTRYRLSLTASDWQAQWQLLNPQRQIGQGASIEHVFLTTGDFTVRVIATSPDGRQVTRDWPLTVFPIEHETPMFAKADPATYVPLISADAMASMTAAELVEFARFHDEFGVADTARRAAESLLGRSDASPADRRDMLLLLAGDAGLDFTSVNPDAARQLSAALELETDPAGRIDLFARLVRIAGIGSGDLEQADALFAQAEEIAKAQKLAASVKSSLRRVMRAAGDVALCAGRRDQAYEHYRAAELLADPVIPQPVRTARVGAMPETVLQHLAAKRLDEALATVQAWRDDFPADQLQGTPLFYLGKVRFARGEHALAVRPLQLAIELGPGSEFEPEARWLLAQSLDALGDRDAAVLALRALVNSGIASPFRQRAIEALAAEQK